MDVDHLNQKDIEIDRELKLQTFKARKPFQRHRWNEKGFFGFFYCVLSSGQGREDEFYDLAIKLHSNTSLLSNNFQGGSH